MDVDLHTAVGRQSGVHLMSGSPPGRRRVGVESSHEGTKLAPVAAKHLGRAQFDTIGSLELVHRIFTAAPEIKFRGCLSKGPKDFKATEAGPPDAWRKICLRWQQGEPLSLEDTGKAMSDGRYIAYVPETAGLVGLDLDKGDFESAEQRIAAEFPHAIRVKSVSGKAYHVLFAAPRDRSQELPHKFALFGGEGVVRYDKGYLCFNSDPYLEGLADAVEMAAKGILPELPLDRIMLDGSARGAGPRRRSSQSNQRRGRPIESMTKVLQGISPGCDRDVWLRVGMGIHDETRGSDPGYELFEQWSAGDLGPSSPPANYTGPEDTRKAWDSFELREDDARTTFGTVVALANEAGMAPPSEVQDGSASAKPTPGDPSRRKSGDDPYGDPDPCLSEEAAAKQEDALARVRQLIEEGHYEAARRELAALDSQAATAQETLARRLSEGKTAKALAKILDEEDPSGTLKVQTDWTGEPERREWLAEGWLPAGRVTLLAAHGGSAKSLFALQVAAVVASGEGFVATGAAAPAMLPATKAAKGKAPRLCGKAGVVVFATWEDEGAEVLRRLSWLPETTHNPVRDVVGNRLHTVDLAGRGALWGPVGSGHRDTVATLTATGAALESYVRKILPRLIVIDPVAAAYGGNENDRGAVRAWLSHLNALAAETGAAVLLVAHPPKGRDAEHYSGSTDWRNGVRALWTLGPATVRGYVGKPNVKGDPRNAAEAQCLTLEKANYARSGRRAWLRFTVKPGDDGPDGPPEMMVWEEAGALEAADAYHAWKRWDRPKSKEQQAKKSGQTPTGGKDAKVALDGHPVF